jgi:adenylate cyclase
MAMQEVELKELPWPSGRLTLTFRTSITLAVMAFIIALATLLIAIQVRALHWATKEAASAYMDATSTKASERLQTEIAAIASLVRVLATSPSVAGLKESAETGPAIALLKASLQELPQIDSICVGFENGAWLQVQRISDLNEKQRERLRATPHADIAISSIRPALVANCPCDAFLKIGRATMSDNWIYGNTDKTPVSGLGITTRSKPTSRLSPCPIFRQASAHR